MAEGQERGVIDSIRDWAGQKSECKNNTDKEMRVCVQDKEASKSGPNNPTGEWRGETKTIGPGETLRVDPSKNDIEGVLHPDGGVTKHHGNFWTSEHDKEWVKQKWPGCGGQTGKTQKGSSCSFLVGDTVFAANASPFYTFARVNSQNNNWNEGRGLEPNSKYRIIPRSSDRWTINTGATFEDFHGSGNMDGHLINIPKNPIRLGGLTVLVWHHNANGTANPEIITFPPGVNAAETQIGAHGGSMHFIIADMPGTYGDNFGDCIVAVARI